MDKHQLASALESRSAEEKYHLRIKIDIEGVGSTTTLLSPDVEKNLAAMLDAARDLEKPDYLWEVTLIDGSVIYDAHIKSMYNGEQWDENTLTGETAEETMIEVSNYCDMHCAVAWRRIRSVEPSVQTLEKLVNFWDFEIEESDGRYIICKRYKEFLLRVYNRHFAVDRYDEDDRYLTRVNKIEPNQAVALHNYFPNRIVEGAVSLNNALVQRG